MNDLLISTVICFHFFILKALLMEIRKKYSIMCKSQIREANNTNILGFNVNHEVFYVLGIFFTYSEENLILYSAKYKSTLNKYEYLGQ